MVSDHQFLTLFQPHLHVLQAGVCSNISCNVIAYPECNIHLLLHVQCTCTLMGDPPILMCYWDTTIAQSWKMHSVHTSTCKSKPVKPDTSSNSLGSFTSLRGIEYRLFCKINPGFIHNTTCMLKSHQCL